MAVSSTARDANDNFSAHGTLRSPSLRKYDSSISGFPAVTFAPGRFRTDHTTRSVPLHLIGTRCGVHLPKPKFQQLHLPLLFRAPVLQRKTRPQCLLGASSRHNFHTVTLEHVQFEALRCRGSRETWLRRSLAPLPSVTISVRRDRTISHNPGGCNASWPVCTPLNPIWRPEAKSCNAILCQ